MYVSPRALQETAGWLSGDAFWRQGKGLTSAAARGSN